MLRLAHTTDVHWFVPPSAGRLSPKRLLGSANLYLRGRRHHFQPTVQDDLVAAIRAQGPDAFVLTGDLTAQALPEEFALAHRALHPLLAEVPSLVQCGNHDVYTAGAAREGRLRRWFGDWLRDDGALARLRIPGLTVIGLDPNRPHWSASGLVPDAQLAALPDALAAVPADDALVLALHYPVVHRDGSPYEGWEHGLRNARDLIEVLRRAPRKPALIVHGHVHHGYTANVDLGGVAVPTHDPGSGGYAWLPDVDRAACFNVYRFDGPTLAGVERFRYAEGGFAPEPGGAYATGR